MYFITVPALLSLKASVSMAENFSRSFVWPRLEQGEAETFHRSRSRTMPSWNSCSSLMNSPGQPNFAFYFPPIFPVSCIRRLGEHHISVLLFFLNRSDLQGRGFLLNERIDNGEGFWQRSFLLLRAGRSHSDITWPTVPFPLTQVDNSDISKVLWNILTFPHLKNQFAKLVGQDQACVFEDLSRNWVMAWSFTSSPKEMYCWLCPNGHLCQLEEDDWCLVYLCERSSSTCYWRVQPNVPGVSPLLLSVCSHLLSDDGYG